MTRQLPAGFAVLFAVSCVAAGVTYAVGGALTDRAGGVPRPAAVSNTAKQNASPPAAKEFRRLFVELTNAYALEHGDPARVSNPDCIQASQGHYMCSYATTAPEAGRQCHIMQARWTPNRDSSFTVTLAGRTARCGSLREALRSLR